MASKLAIEVDGSQHVVPDGLKRDAIRTRYLRQRGVRVLRFSDRDVLLESETVLAVVEQALDFGVDSGAPSP